MKEPGSVQSMTKRRERPRGSIVPRLAAASRQGWQAGWQAATTTWRTAPDTADAALAAAARGRERRRLSPTLRRRLLAGLGLVLVLLLGCGALNLSHALSALAAARDAKGQVSAIQATLKGGGTTDATHLQAVQVHLNALSGDLQRLQAAVPFQPVLSHTPGASGMVHLLRMASDLVQAGQAAMPAAIILAPHLKEMLASLQGSGATTPPGPPASAGTPSTPAPPPLTVASVQQAGAALDAALPLLRAALTERAGVSDTDLRLIGLGKYLPLLHQLDAYTPYVPQVLATLHAVAGALPTLLGVGQPTSFILFNLDSDELRPTGGFLGNYALLTLDGGKLPGGVHLHDIYSLDCPKGQALCPDRLIPAQFAWMEASPHRYGLHDSNLDPDYPASARLAEQLLVQQDQGPAVQGVFSITPRVIEQMLQATGPITITSACAQVTAQNLRDVIHYFHLSNALGMSSWCPGPQPAASSDRKAFDAELGSTLLHRVATLPSAQQSTLVHALLSDFATRDIQLYFNDPRLEAALTSFGLDGTVQTPHGDSLFVVDTNTGANYANHDIQEQVADAITLDTHGTATHDLTLTYTYPKTAPLYQDVYEASGGYWTYRDVVRVLVPAAAHFQGQTGDCTPVSAQQAGHAVWGCSFLFAQPNTVTLHVRWTVPNAATRGADGTLHYQLLVQHEAGTRPALSLTIAGPHGAQLVGTPTAPLVASDAAGTAQVGYAAASFAQDQSVAVSFQP